MTKPKSPAKLKTKRAPGASKPKRARPSRAKPKKSVALSELEPAKMLDRLSTIYALEEEVERRRVALDVALRARTAAKEAFEAACEELKKEIHDQRCGPGPLYDVYDAVVESAMPAGSAGRGNSAVESAKGPRPIDDGAELEDDDDGEDEEVDGI